MQDNENNGADNEIDRTDIGIDRADSSSLTNPSEIARNAPPIRGPAQPIQQALKVDNLPDFCTWTNDGTQMALNIYFDPKKPNLALDYNLNGLQPVVKEVDGDIYLLKDGNNAFYKWDSFNGGMWRLEDVTDVNTAVEAVLDNFLQVQFNRIFNSLY